MSATARLLTAAGLALAVSSPAAWAQGSYHHRSHHRALVAGHGYDGRGYDGYGYDGYGYRYSPYPTGSAASSAAIIAAATARAQTEPGVTSELAPDARQTATGGPSGGVPGFSGGM